MEMADINANNDNNNDGEDADKDKANNKDQRTIWPPPPLSKQMPGRQTQGWIQGGPNDNMHRLGPR